MRHPFQHRSDDFFVEVFDRLDLFVDLAHVAGFIDRCHVNEYKIVSLQRPYAVLAFAAIVCVEKAGDARNPNSLKPRVDAQTVDNVDG